MPGANDYQQQIEALDQTALLELWQDIQDRNTPDWEPGRAFEYLVLRAFQLEGAHVTYPYSVRFSDEEVEQIDGAIYADGLACLVECKDQQGRVNLEPVAKMRNQLMRRHASTIGVVFSREGFTSPAITLARYIFPQMILLWDGSEIDYALKHQRMRQSLIAKYRFCVEQSDPLFDIRPPEELDLS
jgi:hypothetical protein